MRVLICSDGSSTAEQSAALISRLGMAKDSEITLLGVSEMDGDQAVLEASFDRCESLLGITPGRARRTIRYGNPAEQILKEVEENPYDLVAIGGRVHSHALGGSRLRATTLKLARLLRLPLLTARNVPSRIERILFCTAAEEASTATLKVGGAMIAKASSEVNLLHVMSQLALRLDSPSEDLRDTAMTAIARHTREGRHLEQAMRVLHQVGITSPIEPHLRHGLVVDEVLAELEEGKYDLLVIGRHYKKSSSRWLELLLEDVTGQLLAQASCSVLTV
jgi:nucleotide-binding universal stress UspA family protein